MNNMEAFVLGLVQGLTEFLPVSSSGHLEIGKFLFGNLEESLNYTVAVHGATVLSIIVVFWKDIVALFQGLFAFQINKDTIYILKILLSAIPVGILGMLFKDDVEALFNGRIHFVGAMLIVTGILLFATTLVPVGKRKISWLDSLIIGIAQAAAVLPGISRSGATIVTGLLLGNDRTETTRFSFLMVLLPVIGANFIEIYSGDFSSKNPVGTLPLVIGFITAFISGLFACKWMLSIVRKGKLFYFAIYCVVVGLGALLFFH
ncbi:MAG TPA: undecaprenyl-diphosphate phosphatase [Bacteroidetes bacterium]|nr:undecaprenyl-diphosphate phosphatase [Bacteroidota bacterium]